jgi:hypothetical protein
MEEKIMKKVVSLKAAMYEKQYKEFYSRPENREISKHVFMKCDVRISKSIKIS